MKRVFFFLWLLQSLTLSAQHKAVVSDDHSELLTVEIYQPAPYSIKGHPFFYQEDFFKCTLHYQNKIYKNIKANLNLYKQELIYYQESQPRLPRYVKLNPGYIDKFSLEVLPGKKHLFYSNKLHPLLPENYAYYEVLFQNSSISYVIGREKNFVELPMNSLDGRGEFSLETNHYFFYAGKLHEIKNRRDILNLFSDQKKNIRRFMRKENIRYSLEEPEKIVSIIKEYENLKTNP